MNEMKVSTSDRSVAHGRFNANGNGIPFEAEEKEKQNMELLTVLNSIYV